MIFKFSLSFFREIHRKKRDKIELLVIYFFIFVATGSWLIFIGLIGFLPVSYQAKQEEALMQETFGKVYEDYISKTGRFLPKIK